MRKGKGDKGAARESDITSKEVRARAERKEMLVIKEE